MAKKKTVYTCSFCGHQSPKWMGRCPDCSQWNSFYEEVQNDSRLIQNVLGLSQAANPPRPISHIKQDSEQRISTHIGELDRVLGGGIVRGAVILIGGDPGIGKVVYAGPGHTLPYWRFGEERVCGDDHLMPKLLQRFNQARCRRAKAGK